MALVGDGELAVTEGVPQLDASVTRSGNDLAVVGRERDGKDVVGVADEAAGGGASGELPETESLVPRRREGIGAVRRDHLPCRSANRVPSRRLERNPDAKSTYTVRDDVGVAVERPLGVAVLGLIAGEVPDDQGLVSAAGEEHVGAIYTVSGCSRRGNCAGNGQYSYFSMDVAKLVTQPFCKESRH